MSQVTSSNHNTGLTHTQTFEPCVSAWVASRRRSVPAGRQCPAIFIAETEAGRLHTDCPTIALPGSRQPEYADRVAWAEANGPIPIKTCPDGSWRWELHHRCFNKDCVNSSHIQLVTQKQHVAIHNVRRAAMRLAKAA